MDAIACNICKESAAVMCMECVARDVTAFLPKSLMKDFRSFHQGMAVHFDSNQLVLNGAVYCFNCRSTRESPICQSCYATEVGIWVRGKRPSLQKRFMKLFSFARVEAKEQPAQEQENGICDECGEYADLVSAEGQWVCNDCTQE